MIEVLRDNGVPKKKEGRGGGGIVNQLPCEVCWVIFRNSDLQPNKGCVNIDHHSVPANVVFIHYQPRDTKEQCLSKHRFRP